MNAYSHLKAFRHPDVLDGVWEGVPRRVPHIEMILADLCQQHCGFCAYRLEGYASNQRFDEKRMMPTDKALEIIDDCASMGVQAVQFTGGGEPTLHPAFMQCFSLATRYMKVGLVTNGIRIADYSTASLTMMGHAAWVRVSLDAATAQTYCKIRKVHAKHWEKAQNAIQLIKQHGAPVVGVGFVVTPDNWREVYDAAALARSLGADNFRISAQFSNEDEKLFEGFHSEAAGLCKEAEKLSYYGFTVYNRFGDRLEDLRLKNPEDKLCGYQFFTTYIGADLQVYRCCGYAYNDRGWIGDLKNQRFKDFWMSQERFDKQFGFDARGCERCQFRRQNQALAYVLDPNPQMHEAFV